jgi:hypothetical protein
MNISLHIFHSRPAQLSCIRATIDRSRRGRKKNTGDTDQCDQSADLAGGRELLSRKPTAAN